MNAHPPIQFICPLYELQATDAPEQCPLNTKNVSISPRKRFPKTFQSTSFNFLFELKGQERKLYKLDVIAALWLSTGHNSDFSSFFIENCSFKGFSELVYCLFKVVPMDR